MFDLEICSIDQIMLTLGQPLADFPKDLATKIERCYKDVIHEWLDECKRSQADGDDAPGSDEEAIDALLVCLRNVLIETLSLYSNERRLSFSDKAKRIRFTDEHTRNSRNMVVSVVRRHREDRKAHFVVEFNKQQQYSNTIQNLH